MAGLVASAAAAVLLAGNLQIWAGVVLTIFVTLVPVAFPKAATVIAQRRILFIVIGLGFGVAALASVFILPDPYGERAIPLAVGAFVAGLAVAYLPFMARDMSRVRADIEEAHKSPPLGPTSFSARADASDALRLLIHERHTLGRTVGPWFLLFCLLPAVLIAFKSWNPATKGEAEIALLLFLVLLLALCCLPLIASIRWARYLAKGEIPSLVVIPLGPLWGVLWRLFFAGVVLRIINSSDDWLRTHLTDVPLWAMSGISGLMSLFVLVVASPWAMIFVMVALGAKDRSAMTAVRSAQSVGRRFYLGMLLILTPMTVLSWLLSLLPQGPKGAPITASDWATYAAWALGMFLTFVVATTYLTRIYLRSRAGQAEFAGAHPAT